jgi:hypothetical protein
MPLEPRPHGDAENIASLSLHALQSRRGAVWLWGPASLSSLGLPATRRSSHRPRRRIRLGEAWCLTSATVMADVWSLILATRRSPVKSSLGLCGRGVDAESDECLHSVLVGVAVEEIPRLWWCCTHEQLQQYQGLNRALEPKNLDSSAAEAECLVGNKNQSLHCIVPAQNQSNCPRRTYPPPSL